MSFSWKAGIQQKSLSVIPAKAGIQAKNRILLLWIPSQAENDTILNFLEYTFSIGKKMKLKYLSRLILFTTTAIILVSTPLFAIERVAVIIGDRVSMHRTPDANTKAIAHVNREMVVEIIGRSENPTAVVKFNEYWYQVNYRGKTGWIFGQFLNLDSNKKGLTRIFTKEELIEYCKIEIENLKRTRNAGAHEALIELSRAFLDDLKDISNDAILSQYYSELDGYRALNAYYLALGYLGIGNIDAAMEMTSKLSTTFYGISLPDGRKPGDLILELNSLIGENRRGGDGAD
jgi:SH3 domain-containing protein